MSGVQQKSLEEKEQFWRDKIAEQRSSALSISAFCENNELKQNAFHWWKARLLGKIKKTNNRSVGSRQKQKRKRRQYSNVQQRRFVQKWRASGMTQAAFCRKEGLLEWQFSNWKCRIVREETEEQAQKPSFAEVKIARSQPPTTSSKTDVYVLRKVIAEIPFAGGAISILSDADAEAIRNILIALMEATRDWTE